MRKYYPFNKRDINSNSKLISGILATFIVAPFSLLNKVNSNSFRSNYIDCDEEKNIFKPRRFKIVNIIYGSFFFMTPFLFAYLIEIDWWVFFAFATSIVYSSIFLLPLIDLIEKFPKDYIFEGNDINNQIRTSKFILKFWAFIFSIHSILLLFYNILQWWLDSNSDFKYRYWSLSHEISQPVYKFLLNIADSSFETKLLLSIALIINIIITTYLFYMAKNMAKNISKKTSDTLRT